MRRPTSEALGSGRKRLVPGAVKLGLSGSLPAPEAAPAAGKPSVYDPVGGNMLTENRPRKQAAQTAPSRGEGRPLLGIVVGCLDVDWVGLAGCTLDDIGP